MAAQQKQLQLQKLNEEQRRMLEQQIQEKQFLAKWEPQQKKADLRLTAKDYQKHVPSEAQWKKLASDEPVKLTLIQLEGKYGEFSMLQKVDQQNDQECHKLINSTLREIADSQGGEHSKEVYTELDFINYEDFLDKGDLVDLDAMENVDGSIYDGQWRNGKRYAALLAGRDR